MRDRVRVAAVLLFTTLFAALPAAAGTISLSWDPAVDTDLAGYRVYYGTSAGSYTQSADVGNVTSTTLSGLSDCTTWYVAVKAYDLAGHESANFSNEISGMPRPTIASASPSAAEQGTTVTLTLTGANFASGATVALGAAGIVVNSVTVLSCSQISLSVTIGGSTPVGATSIDVTNPDQVYGTSAGLFTVQATSNPVVSSTSPADGATGIGVGVSPAVTFSEAMLPASITSANVRLLNDAGTAVAQAAGSPALSADGRTATITLAAALLEGKTYRLQAIGGGSGVTDLAGHGMGATYTQATGFSTASDTTAPVVSAVASGSVTSTSARVTWTTNEAADSQVFYRKSGQTAYQPTAVDGAFVTSHSEDLAGLDPSSTYEYHVRSADAAGNAATSSPDKTFTTSASAHTYLRMEAEAGALTSPMRTTSGTGAFGGAWIDTPSGTPTGTATAPAGTSVLGVNVPVAATWTLWVRLYGGTTSSDSFYESIDGAARSQMTPSPLGTWVWIAGRSYTLTAGLHSIELGGREAQSRADRVLLTNDPLFVPTEQPSGDATPPAGVTSFTAAPANGQLALSWTNPSDTDFVKTVIRYRIDGKYPTSPVDGYLVVEKTGAPGSTGSFTHTGLANGTTYSYAAFAIDSAGNTGAAAIVQGVPADTAPPGVVTNARRTDKKN